MEVACSDFVNYNISIKYSYIISCLQSGLNMQPPDDCHLESEITKRNDYRRYFSMFLSDNIKRLQFQSWLQASHNTGILNTWTRLWLARSEQANPVDKIKYRVRISVLGSEFDKKRLKKAGEHIGRSVVNITIKMKKNIRKPLMIKIIKRRLRN